MAIGLIPKHTEEISLNELTPEQFLVIAIEAIHKMNWKLSYISANGLIAYTDHGIFERNAEIKIKIENNIAGIHSASTGSEMMDFGKNKQYVQSYLHTFNEIKSAFSQEEFQVKYETLKKDFPANQEDILNTLPETTSEKIKGFFSIFVPTKVFFITPILLDINILIFILMALGGTNIMLPDNDSLLNWGANFKPMTLEGQWWRLITCCFIHIGILHLLMNMYALLYIGILLEPLLGQTRFIAAYILTGITASIASLWWHDLTISAGASGAIFGMYGVFLALLTTNFIEKNARKSLLTSIAIFVGYNLLNGMKGGIDNAAHIGGLIGGVVIGYAYIPGLKKPEENKLKYGAIGLATFLVLAVSFAVYTNSSNDIGTYDTKMKEFTAIEEKALNLYRLPENTPNEKLLDEIKNNGINNWNKILKLMDDVEKLNLPDAIKTRNKLLKEYSLLRLDSYKLLHKAISENTEQYRPQLEDYNKKIEAKINELSNQ